MVRFPELGETKPLTIPLLTSFSIEESNQQRGVRKMTTSNNAQEENRNAKKYFMPLRIFIMAALA